MSNDERSHAYIGALEMALKIARGRAKNASSWDHSAAGEVTYLEGKLAEAHSKAATQ